MSGVSTVNHLEAFYDIHGEKSEVLFFYFVSVTTRYSLKKHYNRKDTTAEGDNVTSVSF
jgi:hypothetical protein